MHVDQPSEPTSATSTLTGIPPAVRLPLRRVPRAALTLARAYGDIGPGPGGWRRLAPLTTGWLWGVVLLGAVAAGEAAATPQARAVVVVQAVGVRRAVWRRYCAPLTVIAVAFAALTYLWVALLTALEHTALAVPAWVWTTGPAVAMAGFALAALVSLRPGATLGAAAAERPVIKELLKDGPVWRIGSLAAWPRRQGHGGELVSLLQSISASLAGSSVIAAPADRELAAWYQTLGMVPHPECPRILWMRL